MATASTALRRVTRSTFFLFAFCAFAAVARSQPDALPPIAIASGDLWANAAPATAIDASSGEWTNLLIPGARAGHTAVHDPIRDRMIVFGGFDGALLHDVSVLGLTGLSSWTKLDPLGTPPTGLGAATAIYDPVRDRVVLFGGGEPDTPSEVWVLTLSGTPTWSQLTPAGPVPGARHGHSAIYDPIRDRMIVFAGAGFSYLNDVWTLSFAGTPTWSQLSPTGSVPTPRIGHTAIYDPVRDRMLVLGGADGGPIQSVVWSLSLAGAPAWSQLAVSGTPSHGWDFHTAIYDAGGDRMVAFAGYDGSVLRDDSWALSLSGTPTWSPLVPTGGPPGVRCQHAAIYDPLRGRMIVFGGKNESAYLGDTWALMLDGEPAWSSLVPVVSPPGRHAHAAILDADRNRLVMFGGIGDALLNDTWALTLGTPPTWNQLAPAGVTPNGRTGHSTVYDPARERMLMFGGAYGGVDQVVWALALSGEPTWTTLAPSGSPPAARQQHSAIYDPLRDRMIVFGGVAPSSYLNDTWALTLSGTPTWSQLMPTGTPPSGRYGHTAIYDLARDRMLVFGGQDGAGFHNDVWALALSGTPAWSPLTLAAPSPVGRAGHTAVYDVTRDRMVVFGGQYDEAGPIPYFSDTWCLYLSGTPTWVALGPSGTVPGRRSEHAAIFDPIGERMIVVAGLEQRHADYSDTRVLTFSGTTGIGPEPTPVSVLLAPGRPNPSRGDVTITYALPRATEVTLRVHDVAGRLARTLVESEQPAGSHVVHWDGRTAVRTAVPSGVYFLELQADGQRLMRRVVMLR